MTCTVICVSWLESTRSSFSSFAAVLTASEGPEHVQVFGAQANLLEVVLDNCQVRVLRAEHGDHFCGALEGYGARGRERSRGSHMGSLASDVFTSIDARDAPRTG